MESPAAHYDRLKATLSLDAPVTTVPLVSAKRAQLLRKMGICTVRDLLASYPRRYIDMSQVATIASARIGQTCTIKARVHEVKVKKPKPRMVLAEVTVTDDTGTLIITAFRQPWLADQLKPGMPVAVSGKVEFNYGFKRMTNPYIESLEGEEALFTGVVLPVHPLTAGIKAGLMRRLMSNAILEIRGFIDPLPLQLRMKYRLMSKQNALACIHFPRTMDEQVQARRRLAYEEVLLLELSLMRETEQRAQDALPVSHVTDGATMSALDAAFPFELTSEQSQARDDILARMAADSLMNHMLLGDVGTGKTIVAAFAIAAAKDTGCQALLMAPTEMLASQHMQSIGSLLAKAGAAVALLTGSTPRDERERIIDGLGDGTIDVVFGTHALLEEDVQPKHCSLVIVDEQQRFGVEQRQALLDKAANADELYLTATPIPRTLARALFGDMTLSYIKERPHEASGRTTKVLGDDEKGFAFDAARKALEAGQQVYVVCPLVGVKPQKLEDDEAAQVGDAPVEAYEVIQVEDDSDMMQAPLAAAQGEAEFLQRKVFPEFNVGLLHGKMPSAQKSEVMESFRSGQTQVLVATTIIEVGVDVPNATVMIVEDADRFGLSQLHQLRGRVGRAELPGQVYLVSGNRSDVAVQRLAAMESTEDGFELAAYDLSLRREGDILGNRQHGASLLKLVNVMRDKELIEAAWSDARAIMDEDPLLQEDLHKPLAREMACALKEASCES